MASGYQGRILPTDLSTPTTARDEPDDHFNRKYTGRWSILAYYLRKGA